MGTLNSFHIKPRYFENLLSVLDFLLAYSSFASINSCTVLVSIHEKNNHDAHNPFLIHHCSPSQLLPFARTVHDEKIEGANYYCPQFHTPPQKY